MQIKTNCVIDFRARPPIKEYMGFFEPELVEKINIGVGSITAESFQKRSLEVFMAEMAEVGIEIAVMNGRHVGDVHIDDTVLADLQKSSAGRLIGLAGTDLARPMGEVIKGIEKAVKTLGLRGVTIEHGFAPTPMHADDERLFPIYEKCVQLQVPVLLMSGPFTGPDLTYTDPVHYQHVATTFPKLQIVCGHGCYPYVTEAIAMVYKCNAIGANVYLSPDCYMFTPGGSLYVEGINLYPDNFLFASAYPFGAMTQSVERTLRLGISEKALPKYLYENTKKLLKL